MQNVLFDSTLSHGNYPLNNCNQTNQQLAVLDTSLFNYVSGLRFLVIVDSVHYAGPPSIYPVHAGDTTILSAGNPTYSMLYISGLQYWFSVKIAGVPNTSNQSYLCHLETQMCTCLCPVILIRKSTSDISTCRVDLFNSIKETEKKDGFTIYPNPGSGKFTFSNIRKRRSDRSF